MNEIHMQHGLDWEGENVAGWIATEKMDGCRAYWDGAALWSRGGIAAAIPPAWRAALPAMALDCELYDGIGGVYRCGAALKHGRFTDSMRLMVFDAPGAPGAYRQRMRAAAAALRGCAVAQVLPITEIESNAHALELLGAVQARGGEGLMLRAPGLAYRPGRTRELLKLKQAPEGGE